MRTFVPMLVLALLGLVAAGPTSGSDRLHERLTIREVRQVFNKEPHEVPEYDVVPIHYPRVHKRAYGLPTRINLNAFHRNVNLWLNPTDGILVAKDTPVYSAKSDRASKAGVRFSKIIDPMSEVERLLEDRQKQASIIVKKTASGKNVISGNVGSEGWTVRPLPERFPNQFYNRYRRSTNDVHGLKNATIDDDELVYHVIFKTPEVPEEADYITLPIQDNILNNIASRSKRSAPSIIYPQLLIIVDHETYRLHGAYLYSLLEYLLPFWNGVDLKYRSIENPIVRLNIAGIVVAMDANALSFISENKIAADKLNLPGSLKSLSKYMRTVEHIFPLDSYDIVVAMAPYKMCAQDKDKNWNSKLLGLAYVSGACVVHNSGVPVTQSAFMIQDKGGFDGIHTAAHELGHVFGAKHDDDDACAAEEGHIMAGSPMLTEKSADWSPCTIADFNKFFNGANPKCLYNKPTTKSPLPRVLPGRVLSLDEQCAKIEGTKACGSGESVCRRLRCEFKDDKRWCQDTQYAAAEGTICGTRKICIRGICKDDKDIK